MTNWIEREGGVEVSGAYTETVNGIYLSYQPNYYPGDYGSNIDSANPETAIVIENGKPDGRRRFLIYRGDWREALAEIFPDLEKLKAHYREHGGHFWSDGLAEDETN